MMSPKQVVHVIPAIKIGGVEKLVLSSVSEINKNITYKILVVGEVDQSVWGKLPDRIKSFIYLPSSSHWLLGIVEAAKKLRKLQPDIVITSLWKSASVVMIMGRAPFKHIGFIHTSKGTHFIDKLVLKWQIKNADLLFADSNAANIFINSLHKRAEVKVLPLFFNTNSVLQKTLNRPSLRFCFMGRLDYVKGIDATLEFIKLLFIRGVKFEFDFYGPDEGELYKIEDFIKENPKINVAYKGIIMPWEVNDKLIQYDFFVQFSKFEGMAMSVVEAMQIGVVPVVTSVGEIRDYASHLFNAIILSSTAQQDLISVVEVIENIVDNEALFRRISSNAAATFRNEPNYIESLSNILMNF